MSINFQNFHIITKRVPDGIVNDQFLIVDKRDFYPILHDLLLSAVGFLSGVLTNLIARLSFFYLSLSALLPIARALLF